jgi:hypothetical protein
MSNKRNRLVSQGTVIAQTPEEPKQDVTPVDVPTDSADDTEDETEDETADVEPRELIGEPVPVPGVDGLFTQSAKQELKERIGRRKKGEPKKEPRIETANLELIQVTKVDAVLPALQKFYQNDSAELIKSVNDLLDSLVVRGAKARVFGVKRAIDNLRAMMIANGYSAEEIRAALTSANLIS